MEAQVSQVAVPVCFQRETTVVPDRSRHSPPLVRRHKFATPKLRLQLNDLGHEGSAIFLSNVKGDEDVERQVQNVLNLLYLPESPRPGTRSVTFILRRMGGVAYTTGTDLDDDHKEIHISLDYIAGIKTRNVRDEILGVLCHELVHCFQWSARGTPGGLIEGVADWVRLRAGLAAEHWRQDAKGKWDDGYQHTGYFLDYLETRFGDGTVRQINAHLRGRKYDEHSVFEACCDGHRVDELWEDYSKTLQDDDLRHDSEGDDQVSVGDVSTMSKGKDQPAGPMESKPHLSA